MIFVFLPFVVRPSDARFSFVVYVSLSFCAAFVHVSHDGKKLRSNYSSQKSVSSFASGEFQRETFRIVSSCTREEGVRVGILVVILRDYLSRL